MQRREFITLLSGAALVWPCVARAQQADKVRRIGVLMGYAENDPETKARIAAFLQEMQQLGWTDGRNLQIEYRWETSDLRKAALELVAHSPVRQSYQLVINLATAKQLGLAIPSGVLAIADEVIE